MPRRALRGTTNCSYKSPVPQEYLFLRYPEISTVLSSPYNTHIVTQNLPCNYDCPKPKYLIIGYLDATPKTLHIPIIPVYYPLLRDLIIWYFDPLGFLSAHEEPDKRNGFFETRSPPHGGWAHDKFEARLLQALPCSGFRGLGFRV